MGLVVFGLVAAFAGAACMGSSEDTDSSADKPRQPAEPRPAVHDAQLLQVGSLSSGGTASTVARAGNGRGLLVSSQPLSRDEIATRKERAVAISLASDIRVMGLAWTDHVRALLLRLLDRGARAVHPSVRDEVVREPLDDVLDDVRLGIGVIGPSPVYVPRTSARGRSAIVRGSSAWSSSRSSSALTPPA